MGGGRGRGGAEHEVDGIGVGGDGFARSVREEEVPFIEAMKDTEVMHTGLGVKDSRARGENMDIGEVKGMSSASIIKDGKVCLTDGVGGSGTVRGIDMGSRLRSSDRTKVGDVGDDKGSSLGVNECYGIEGQVSGVCRSDDGLEGDVGRRGDRKSSRRQGGEKVIDIAKVEDGRWFSGRGGLEWAGTGGAHRTSEIAGTERGASNRGRREGVSVS